MTYERNAKTWLKIGTITFLVVVIVGYSIFQARKILEGPDLNLTSPKSGTIYTEPLVEIAGTASNIKEIRLDDRPINITEEGEFREKLLLFPGYNIIKLSAEDKFGKKTEKKIELVYQENG